MRRIVDAVHKVIVGTPPVPDHWHATGLTLTAAPMAVAAPSSSSGTDEPIITPFGDLTASEGALVKWLKAIGDAVTEGELAAEIETDKTVVEIEAPASGVLTSIDRRSVPWCRWAAVLAASANRREYR